MKKFKQRQISAFVLSAATMAAFPATTAVAQEANLALEEVIVTARRRMESLQSAPMAVSAISGEDLQSAGVNNMADIMELVPNLQVARPSRDANVYIRGVGPSRGATNVTELSVGVYIDDVFMLKPQGQLIDLAEVESVQVLRGPQGTLFGKNTTGGALVLTTVKPGEEFGGYGKVTVGNDSQFNVQGSIDIPLSDTLLSKLTVTSVQSDGFFQDPENGDELSDENRIGGLLQMRWLASDDVTADFSYFHNRIRENGLAQGDCVVTNPDAQIPASGLITPVSGLDLVTDFCERASDGAATNPTRPEFDLDVNQLSANIAWDINDSHSFKSITAWRDQETPSIEYTNAFAGYPRNQVSLDDGTSTQFSQEFQFTGDLADGAIRYTTGLFYMYDDSDTGTVQTSNGADGIWAASGGDTPPGLAFVLTESTVTGQENENSTYAAYTQWSWDATDNLELTAGLRYSYEDRELTTTRTEAADPVEAYADVPGAIVIPGTGVLMPFPVFFDNALSALPLPQGPVEELNIDEDYDSLTPMFSAAYTFSDDMLSDSINGLMIYASYTEGYKAGGFSDFRVGELLPFDEENIDSIEVGLKMDAWNNRLRVNAALFSMDYDDMQLFVARPDPDPSNIRTLQGVTNAGQSSIDGFELEVSVVPAEGWLINFAASYADGQFDEFDDRAFDPVAGEVVDLDRSDEDLPSLPEQTYSLGIQYDWDTSFGSWSARADAYYRDEMYWGFDALTWDIPLAREESTTDSFTIYNARVNWQVSDKLAVTAWGRNLADKTYYDGGVGEAANLGHVIKSFAPPRRYGIDVRYDF